LQVLFLLSLILQKFGQKNISMEFFNTSCPRNCYSTCSFRVGVENGKVKAIEPQPLNLATPEGICLKGLSYIERANSPDRILYPLKKEGTKFIRINWETAYEILAEKITYYKNMYGSHSILFYAASGMSGLLNGVSTNFWKMIGGTTRVYGNLCWPAGLEATRLTLGENKHNVAWDIENAALIILWGKNPAETNIQQMIPIEKAQQRGAKLVVIDPRRTPSSERADLLIQPKPGTDGLLALMVAKLIIENNQVDTDFVKKYVLGFDAFKDSLKGITLEKTAHETGVSIPFILELARLIGTVKPMTLVTGYGMQRFSNGGQTVRCLLSLNVLTGNIGKKGACWHYADLQGDVFDPLKEPQTYYPDAESDFPFRRVIPTAKLGEAMLSLTAPELKMIWVERGNPLTQNPDSEKIREAFRRLEFKVVVEQFMTDTALEADLIFPAKNMFEQTDVISSYWNPYVQIRQKVVEPAGEVKPETTVYFELARKLGFTESEIRENIPSPTVESIEAWLSNELKPFVGLTLETLKTGPVLAPGLQEIAFSDCHFNTPSGKIELLSVQANKRWGVAELPSYEPIVMDSDGSHPYQLMTPNTKNRIHSQFGNLELIKLLDPVPYATISMVDAKLKSIKQGDRIRIFNHKGSLEMEARVDASMRQGVVVIYNGYWHQEGACPNVFTKGRETDMGHGTAFHDTWVDFDSVNAK
jgi:anaerobic selenocysteine-containing dehydrogenase